MNFKKAKDNEVIKVDNFLEFEEFLKEANEKINKVELELKDKDNKIAILSEKVASISEKTRAYKSIERNSETVFSKSGFSTKFIQNVSVLNTDYIIQITPIIYSNNGISVGIKTTNGDIFMETKDKSLYEEFKNDYGKLLQLI